MIVDAVVGAVGELLAGRARTVAACGLDHQGESVLAWDAETGKALTPVVTWQDKRSQEILDRLEADGQGRADPEAPAGCRSTRTSRPGSWPGCSSTTTRSRRRSTPGRRGSGRSTRSSATGSAPGSPPTPRPRRAPSSVRPSGTRRPARGLRRARATRCREIMDTAGDLGTLQPPLVAGRPAASSADCRPAGRARRRRVRRCRDGSRRPTAPACSCSPMPATCARSPRAASSPPSPGGSTARWSGRSTAACSPPARCSNGSAATSAWPPIRPRWRPRRRRWRTAAACACCPRSPASAPPGGRPRPAPSSPG